MFLILVYKKGNKIKEITIKGFKYNLYGYKAYCKSYKRLVCILTHE